jgi:uncharacterized protein (TIGR03437 family)
VAIFGRRLSDATSVAQTLPLDFRRAGTEVNMAGHSLPLYFTSDGQLVALLPFDLQVNTSHQLVVQRGNTLSIPESVPLAAARPALYATNGLGFGPGHIYRSGEGGVLTLANAQNPVRAGDYVVIYASGLGAVNPPVEPGQAAPLSVLSWIVNLASASISIGGQPAQVLFAGLAPGLAGVYQVNTQIPPGVTPGDAVPMVMTVAGQPSPPVTMSVR